MKLNKKELKKLQYDFNSICNRLLQADYQDYSEILGKFLKFLNSTPIILDYIKDCGVCDWNLKETIQSVQSAYGRELFDVGETDEEEVRNVYAVLNYLVETNNSIYHGVAMGYSSSNKYQDKIKSFNERFVMILIRHIERYLTKVGIDMGLDDRVVYNVTVDKGQAIIATDNATVTATNNVGIDVNELRRLIADIQSTAQDLSEEDRQTVSECIEVIETEAVMEKPKKGMLKMATSALTALKGTAEFGAAVASLIQFVGPLIH
jgi:hypothetical protein